MRVFAAFNGDADGLIAQHQLRLAGRLPKEVVRITGIKRDIKLVARCEAQRGDALWALDVSLAANREALVSLLHQGVRVHWIDHHEPGEIPAHPLLAAQIDTDPEVCTSLIIDRMLDGRFRPWAIAAAFGDNLHAPASRLARAIGLSEAEAQALRTLGETINYNAYGLEIEDLHMHPKALAEAMDGFTDPWAFMQTDAFRRIAEGFAEDRAAAESLKPEAEGPGWAVYALPDAPWARRMIGVLANELARAHPERAHALLLPMPGGWRVSVRAPKSRPYGAGKLCAQFPTGGGREAAGGINLLPDDLRASFIDALARAYQA